MYVLCLCWLGSCKYRLIQSQQQPQFKSPFIHNFSFLAFKQGDQKEIYIQVILVQYVNLVLVVMLLGSVIIGQFQTDRVGSSTTYLLPQADILTWARSIIYNTAELQHEKICRFLRATRDSQLEEDVVLVVCGS